MIIKRMAMIVFAISLQRMINDENDVQRVTCVQMWYQCPTHAIISSPVITLTTTTMIQMTKAAVPTKLNIQPSNYAMVQLQMKQFERTIFRSFLSHF